MRVGIALSGGVDSAIACYLLKKSGIEPVALTFDHSYLSKEQLEAAIKIAKFFNIEHYILDVKKLFEKEVIKPFIEFYKTGRTPNPCTFCNASIKFGYLFEFATNKLSLPRLATGHYVKIKDFKGYPLLCSPKDSKKDQTYFLSLISQKVLSKLEFPLEDFTKGEVKKLAEKLGLPCTSGRGSQDICFLKGKPLKEFLKKFLPEKPGKVIYQGKAVGEHKGIYWYTIGQRRGLRLPLGKPLYVAELRAEENEIVLTEEEGLYSTACLLEDLNLHLPLSLWNEIWGKIWAKVRYRSPLKKIKKVEKIKEGWFVEFAEPVKAITPGQVCAFYSDGMLLGGGIIKKVKRNGG